MNHAPPAALLWSAPPSRLVTSDLEAVLWITLVLLASAFFSALRVALQHSLPDRVLGRTKSKKKLERVAPLLERADSLAASAGIFKITCDLVFVALLLGLVAKEATLEWTHLGFALVVAAPTILLLTESLPAAIARHRGDSLLLAVLPTFQVLQWPVGLVVGFLSALRGAILRMIGVPDQSASSRRIVEGLREVIEETALSGDLDPSERELIENVMDFRDVDVAEVMTPRTEIHGIGVTDSLDAAVRVFAENGHSRIAVYEESIDTIIGTLTALEVTKALANEELDTVKISDLMRPATFVPETKLVSELLSEFRAEKQKMAIVLDEYGGTAGLVTLADITSEIVGDVHDEYAEPEPEPVREIQQGLFEVQAAVHVSDVNEALDLEIPEEEDFETLGGFVLAELGHLPKAGEQFMHQEVEYEVLEASDRRVLRVSVKRSA